MSLASQVTALATRVATEIKNLRNSEIPREVIPFSMTGTLTTKTGTLRVYMDNACVVESVRIAVATAPSGGSVIVDVNRNGTTIYGTQANRPTIATGTNSATGGAASNATFAAGDYLTVDVDTITAPAADLLVAVRMKRTG